MLCKGVVVFGNDSQPGVLIPLGTAEDKPPGVHDMAGQNVIFLV